MVTELILAGLGVLVSVIGWLLAKRDDKRQEEIKANAAAIEATRTALQNDINELFRLRHLDAMSLADYKLDIAKNHYTSTEMDSRFDQLNHTMEKGFDKLNEAIKAMAIERRAS